MDSILVRQAISSPRRAGHLESGSLAECPRRIRRGAASSVCTRICQNSGVACKGILPCRGGDIHSPRPARIVSLGQRSRGGEYLQERFLRRSLREEQVFSIFSGLSRTTPTALVRGPAPSGPLLSVSPIQAFSGDGPEVSSQGVVDMAPLYRNWSDLLSSVTSSESIRDGFDRLGQSAASALSKGSELADSIAAKLGDVTLPSQTSEAFQEELSRLERSAAAILSKGTDILDNFAATNSGEIGIPLLGQASSSDAVSSSSAVDQLGQSAAKLLTSAGALSSEFGSRVSQLTGDVVHFDSAALSRSTGQLISQIGAAVGGYYHGLGTSAVPVTSVALAAVAGSAVALVSSNARSSGRRMVVEGEDLPLRYDPAAIESFFRRRPVDIVLRSLSIMTACSALTVRILFDMTSGRAAEYESRRAIQLVDLITRLGPTAIKIGQALSIRPDLLPVAYLEELQKLQDRVSPFSNEEAKILIFLQLGKTAEEVFSEMSESPVAAASLGQVYKGRLRETGETVAIKVQRPGVLEGISRDLFLLRAAAYSLQAFPIIQSDLVALLDTWAFRFFDELDYVQEGRNAEQFADNMKSLANVTVPAVYMQYTSRKVLTTEWIEGEKLSESKTDDLLPLVSTALNCYLVQLLESGFLHADPHPGNLLRTRDGRLCVLDFGLMTQVTEDQRYALIEYISHLVNSDYAKVAQDLVRLGFVPPHLADPEKTAAVVPQLSRVLGQLVQGGGARKINVQQITDDLANISKDYVFVLPPYFALILRAFSVLEGIGLEADPDYTIVNECYPYISKRLLTDDSPRARAALKDFLYGGKGQLDMQRVEEIVGGFQSFRELMAPAEENRRSRQRSQIVDPITKEALITIFAPEGSYIQELLLTELVRSVDALSREALAQLWQLIASTIRIPGIPLPAPFAVPGSWPLPLPGLFFGMTPVARLSAEDEQSLDSVKRIWKLLEPNVVLPTPADIWEILQDIVPLLFNLFPGVTAAAQRFNAMLLQRLAFRIADDLDGANSVLEWNKDPMASARHIQPLRLFSLQRVQKERV